MKTAFLFPGQGTQTVGMGKDIYEKYEEAKEVYEKASKITGIDIKKLCFEGPENVLMKTENTQIAILTTSLAILKIIENNGIKADIAVGLSLGEYAALIYGGYISFEDGIRLIQKRGYYMSKFSDESEENCSKYSMAAVIGLNAEKIEEICEEIRKIGKFIVPANYNCSSQTVISGTSDVIDFVIEKLKEYGAKRVIKLKTSGPFHTEKLKKASELFKKELDKVQFEKGGEVKVIKNLDGEFYTEENNIKEILSKHIISPVRFDKAIQLMKIQNIERFIEIGPGRTLTGFVKKDYPEAELYNINNLESLEKFINK
mgnify:CR=1 FL=1